MPSTFVPDAPKPTAGEPSSYGFHPGGFNDGFLLGSGAYFFSEGFLAAGFLVAETPLEPATYVPS